VFFGDRGRAAGEADILINPTNGASYTGTIVQSQQVASSKLRAAETGRWVVQVSPTGFSAFVSPAGDVFQRTDVSERAVITMEVPRRTGTTWYQTLGDLPWIALVAAVFLLTHTHQRLHVRVVSDTSRTAAGSGLEQQGDGAVVDDRDVHLGAEPAGRDDRAVPT
ncbi:MAG: hypothetical protein HKN41_12220, partial [Ilumatobacter sp.]|nr:hypothetical protein [Ilumatobacter sp.]